MLRNRIFPIAVIAAATVVALAAQAPPDGSKKLSFDAVSIKPSDPGGRGRSNFPLTEGERYAPNDGLFSASGQTLLHYIAFAYDLNAVPDPQLNALPEWAKNTRYDIDARASHPATKDEMRAMMRSLLADRFQLKAHYEMRNMSIFELVMTHPGHFGPQMRPHVDEEIPCGDGTATPTLPAATGAAPAPLPPAGGGGGRGAGPRATPDGYPLACGDLMGLPGAPAGRTRLGGRNVTMDEFMAGLRGGMERPIVDKTGLTGRFDWWIEYVQDPSTDGAGVATSGRYLDPDGPKLWTAIKEQLGLELKATKGDTNFLVFDHIERPSAN